MLSTEELEKLLGTNKLSALVTSDLANFAIATGRLLNLRLVPAETSQAYMEALGVYLAPYGGLVAMYSDQTPYTAPPSNADFEAI